MSGLTTGRTMQMPASTSTPLRDTAGGITAVLSVTRDVTNLRRHERALLEQARALETINRVGAQLGAELNLEKLIQAVTDAGRELTGAEFGAFFYNHTDEKGDSYTLYTLSGAPREAFANFPHFSKTKLAEILAKIEQHKPAVMMLMGVEDSHNDPMMANMRRMIPDIHIAILPYCGHYLAIENPQDFNAAVYNFMSGALRRRSS